MLKVSRKKFLFLILVMLLSLLQEAARAQTPIYQTSTIFQMLPDGTNCNMSILVIQIGTTPTPDPNSSPSGPLISIENDGNFLSFGIAGSVNPTFTIYTNTAFVPPDSLSETYTLTWTNYSTNETFGIPPTFLLQPQSQSAFVGNTVIFPSQVYHTTNYQWQLNGTNLTDNGHFIGTTNATLIITNVQLADAGAYTVIANTSPSQSATQSVFKPIQLGIAQIQDFGFRLLIANKDGSPFESNRIPNLEILSAGNLVNWNDVTQSGLLTNGVLQIDYPDDGSTNRFWRVMEQPSE